LGFNEIPTYRKGTEVLLLIKMFENSRNLGISKKAGLVFLI